MMARNDASDHWGTGKGRTLDFMFLTPGHRSTANAQRSMKIARFLIRCWLLPSKVKAAYAGIVEPEPPRLGSMSERGFDRHHDSAETIASLRGRW